MSHNIDYYYHNDALHSEHSLFASIQHKHCAYAAIRFS